jgi:hypothetical protein
MSNAAKSRAVAVAAKIAGQGATIGAHGVPVGPLAEEVVGDLLGALLDVQDEQLATLRNIEKSVTKIGRDVAQLIEGPYQTAREMVERAMIPGQAPDAVKADLQAASAEYLRAAAQHPDASLPRASAYMEAAFVQGLLGGVQAMRYYGDKAWREALAALRREAVDATDALRHPTEKIRRGRRSFWSSFGDLEFRLQVNLLSWGEGGEGLAETFPEAQAIQHVHDTKRQVDVYRDVAVNLVGGSDVHPYHMPEAHLSRREDADVVVWQVYEREQIMGHRDALASFVSKPGINGRLFAICLFHDFTKIRCLELENLDEMDPRAIAFKAEVEQIFPYGLPVSGPTTVYGSHQVTLA